MLQNKSANYSTKRHIHFLPECVRHFTFCNILLSSELTQSGKLRNEQL
jgi:hypothetical protein